MKKTPILIAVAVIALAAVAWFVLMNKPETTGKLGADDAAQEPASGLGADIYGQVQQNPGIKVPDVAPIQNDLNPYNNGYVNPF